MFVKLILLALLEAKAPGFRPITYALFPPLGLAALAGTSRTMTSRDGAFRAQRLSAVPAQDLAGLVLGVLADLLGDLVPRFGGGRV